MKYTPSATAIAAVFFALFTVPAHAASFSAINPSTIKFTPSTSEADLMNLGAASISFGNTTVYIGTHQVSDINQDPIVTSFTNGIRDWVQSYDTSQADARGIGLLWDEGSSSLYGAFTIDGGSTGANSFSAATQGGWLSSYGTAGTNGRASVLLKLNPTTGGAEAGTYIRAEQSDGTTNTVIPTDLDFVNGNVVFFGDSFFVPLDTAREPFDTKTTDAGSPFPYRVVFTPDLTEAVSAEAIGWNGVTEFSALSGETPPTDDEAETPSDDPIGEVPNPGETPDNSGDEVSDPPGDAVGDGLDDGEEVVIEDGGSDVESVPEPGLALGLGAIALATGLSRKGRETRSA